MGKIEDTIPFEPKIFYVDIDNTICRTEGTDYENARPIERRIRVLNKMHDLGHTIVYYTARGRLKNLNLRPLTEKQLVQWGCKYDDLRMDKPIFDYLVDDRAVQPSALNDTRHHAIALRRGAYWRYKDIGKL